MRKGVTIVVATPGRFLDHLMNTQSIREGIRARPFRWLVFDEADRLMDAGFEKQVGEILNALNELAGEGGGYTQKILVSATISPAVSRLAMMALKDPVTIEIAGGGDTVAAAPQPAEAATEGESFTTPKQLVQHFLVVESKKRLTMLAAFVRRQVLLSGYTSRIVIFVSSRACAEFLQRVFTALEWPPAGSMPTYHNDDKAAAATVAPKMGLSTKWWALHGSIAQKDRRKIVNEFSKAKGGVLLCTDVAARGLDLPLVDWIVQYDPPAEISEYVHRVGRTARSGRKGSAVLFLRPEEREYVHLLASHGLRLLELQSDSIYTGLTKNVDLSGALDGVRHDRPTNARKHPGGMNHKDVDMEAVIQLLQQTMENIVCDNQDATSELQVLASDAFLSYVSAYAVHSRETRHIFQPRALHLGHVARSFALREPPRGVSGARVIVNQIEKWYKNENQTRAILLKPRSNKNDPSVIDPMP